jgi:hypothetical protein
MTPSCRIFHNRADRLGMAETDDEPSVGQLEDTALDLHGGMRGLIEQSTHWRLPFGKRNCG